MISSENEYEGLKTLQHWISSQQIVLIMTITGIRQARILWLISLSDLR